MAPVVSGYRNVPLILIGVEGMIDGCLSSDLDARDLVPAVGGAFNGSGLSFDGLSLFALNFDGSGSGSGSGVGSSGSSLGTFTLDGTLDGVFDGTLSDTGLLVLFLLF